MNSNRKLRLELPPDFSLRSLDHRQEMAQQILPAAPEAGPSNPAIALPKTPRRQRPGKKEKLQIRQQLAAEAVEVATVPVELNGVPETEAWSWFPLADAASLTCPVVFNQDSR